MTPYDHDSADFDDDMAADGPPNRSMMAASVLRLLQDEPGRYRSFGPYWPLVKALLLKHYTRDNLFLLGPSVDREAAAFMPPHADVDDALAGAIAFYNAHRAHGLGGNEFTDPETGDTWRLVDPDAGGL